jgi:hypothetical protein
MDRKGPGVLRMLRFAVLLGLAVLVAGAAGLTLLYRGLVFDSLVEGEEHANVGLTRTFTNAIWPAHAGFVLRARDIEPGALAARGGAELGARCARSPRHQRGEGEVYDTRG